MSHRELAESIKRYLDERSLQITDEFAAVENTRAGDLLFYFNSGPRLLRVLEAPWPKDPTSFTVATIIPGCQACQEGGRPECRHPHIIWEGDALKVKEHE